MGASILSALRSTGAKTAIGLRIELPLRVHASISLMPKAPANPTPAVQMNSSFSAALLLLAAVSTGLVLRAEQNWARFGGPEGSGRSAETSLPVKWDPASVVWKTPLKGTGQSAAVNWGDRLFLTSASPDGSKRWVHCLDRPTGKLKWEREVAVANPEAIHKMNTFASASCVTDGERVVAFFGVGGIHCFDLDGNPKWSRELGSFPGPWGVAASPIIDGNVVIQN